MAKANVKLATRPVRKVALVHEPTPESITLELSISEALEVAALLGISNPQVFQAYSKANSFIGDSSVFGVITEALGLRSGADRYKLRETFKDYQKIARTLLPGYKYEAALALARELHKASESESTVEETPSLTFTYHGVTRKILNPEFKGTLLGGVEVERAGVKTEGQYKNYHLDQVNR